MANAAEERIRFWAYPATILVLWAVVSAVSLGELATIRPSLAPPPPVEQPLQEGACDVC